MSTQTTALLREKISGRPCRVPLMLAGSLAFHVSLVLLGAVWPQPLASQPVGQGPTIVDIGDGPPDDGNPPRAVSVPIAAPTPDRGQPTPESGPVRDDAPPLINSPDMQDPDGTPAPPKPRAVHRQAAVTLAGAVRGSVARPGVPDGSPDGLRTSGGSGSAVGQRWSTPSPPYPPRALNSHVEGSSVVRVTTDAAGNVVTVLIIKSAGNAILDFTTKEYVRDHWKGPPNSTRDTEFVYRIR